jgi:hypothetical protein
VLQEADKNVRIVGIPGTSRGQVEDQYITSIKNLNSTLTLNGTIVVCLKSGTTNSIAAIVINGQNRQASTDILYDDAAKAKGCL